MLGQRRRQRAGEVDHGAFAGVVGQRRHHCWVAPAQTGHRGNVDDSSALAAFDHVQPNGATDKICAVNVGADHFVPGFEGQLSKRRAPGGAGVVDQDVDVAEVVEDLPNRGFDLVVVRDITARRHRLDALGLELLDGVGQTLFTSRGDGDRGARFAKTCRDLQPQPAAPAGDQGDLAIETKGIENTHRASSLDRHGCAAALGVAWRSAPGS